MGVLIGHASKDERAQSSGGQSGDQTGKEVYVGYWYNGSWNVVLRPKSKTVAEEMASACEILCKSNLVGYDQGERNSLWDELERVGWKPSALKTPCETDCSAFVTACARCAGVDVPRVALGGGRYNAPVTQTMRSAFLATGAFELLTDSRYLASDGYLRRGDVLVRESGHTAMALGDGAQAGTTAAVQPARPAAVAAATAAASAKPAVSIKEVIASGIARHFDTALAGTYESTASVLNIRDAAGTDARIKVLTQIRRGTTVRCYGFYSVVDEVKWLYIQLTQGNIRYTAFASEEFLKKL